MKINLEGYPVTITSLSDEDLQDLQNHYLPLILNNDIEEPIIRQSKISKNESELFGDKTFFNKFNETIFKAPYIESYIDSFMFQFPFTVELSSWYNVHHKYDHQQLHNHICTGTPAFSSVVILKQPNNNAGQFVFRTPNLSNHLKYLELDPLNKYPNVYEPPMQDGVMIIFPSCLEHYVYYNQTDEPRVVFATNIIIKKDNGEGK